MMLELEEEQVVRTESSEISMLTNDVVQIRFLTDSLVLLEEAFEIDNIITSKMMDGPKFILLNALYIQSNMNSSSQRYFSKESQLRLKTKGVAILLNNLPIRLTASVFIKFHKPPYPTKIFNQKEAALKWFQQIEP
ncbi:MAG: hypothetical protein ABJG68_03620 [Crocinitomicaceae bacterium]